MTRIPVDAATVADVVSVNENDTVAKVNQLMIDGKFNGLPVVSADGHIVGFIAMNDVLRV